jgi:NAD(P)-dependent dehydrogenase (short-subunit alcohol dehydrogenase family)
MKVQYFDLKDKRALVSGGASGIGASIVEHLCEQGVEVYFFDIDKKEAQKLISKIKKKNKKYLLFNSAILKILKNIKL